jgi:hypothetical protein
MRTTPLVCLVSAAIGCTTFDDQDVPDDDPTATTEQSVLATADAAARAVPGDFDGDGWIDLSVKASNGNWYIDLSANGFGGVWDRVYTGYGAAAAIPVPADYDGDGTADLSVKDSTGFWGVDYAWNGFGVWDVMVYNYGAAAAIPVPADYDGDGLVDLAVKDDTGFWGVDHAADGFGIWNDQRWGYGNATWVPVPGKFDSDARADRAIKNAAGEFYIDDSANGFGGKLCTFCTPGNWDRRYPGYGDGTAVPVAADYDNDGHNDLSVRGNGTWLIDYWAPNYALGSWDWPNTGFPFHGANSTTPLPADYDHDGTTDLAWKDNATGWWYVDYRNNGYRTTSPYYDTAWPTANRAMYNAAQPYIYATNIQAPNGGVVGAVGGQVPLQIGVRYVVDVVMQPGNPAQSYNAGVERNPNVYTPPWLNIGNIEPHLGASVRQLPKHVCTSNHDCGEVGDCNLVTNRCNSHRRFSLVCSEAGSFPLAFQMRDAAPDDQVQPGTGNAFNPDHGIRVSCGSSATGLFGRVTRRVQVDRLYQPGTIGVASAQVSIDGGAAFPVSSDGSWSAPGVTGGPHTISIEAGAGYSPTRVVNVTVPPGQGVRVDTPIEEAFVLPPGSTYTQYIDYSRGRTIFHVVDAATATSSLRTELTPGNSAGTKYTLLHVAEGLGNAARVVMNGSFSHPGGEVGYFYALGYAQSVVPDGGPFTSPPLDTFAQSPQISVERARYGKGAAIPVSFVGMSGVATDRIAIAPLGAPASTWTVSTTTSRRSGTQTFGAVADGTYVARAFIGGVVVAQSAAFVVGRTGGTARVTANAPSYPPGADLWVSYSGLPASYTIGFTPAGAPAAMPLINAVPGSTAAGGFWASAPEDEAAYELRVLSSSGALVTSSPSFAVAPLLSGFFTSSLLAITGTATNQNVRVVHDTPSDFWSNTSPWFTLGGTMPIYDPTAPFGSSDISYGFQCWPTLVRGGRVIQRVQPDLYLDYTFARTMIGTKPGRVLLVISDGEGIHGGHGSTFNQSAEFLRDVLGATDALNLDGGLSTEMVLTTPTTRRAVNTITGEDGRIQHDPFYIALPDIDGGIGTVNNYVRLGP